MGNRIIFMGIIIGTFISTIFTVKLSISSSNDFFTQILLGGMGFILQIGSYSILGIGLNLLEKKNTTSKKIFGIICLIMTFILFGINILGSSGLIYETSRNTYIKNSLTSKEYKEYEDDYKKYKSLEKKEIDGKEILQNELDELNIKHSDEIKAIRKNRETEYNTKIDNTKTKYNVEITKKKQQYLITSKGGSDELEVLRDEEIDNIKEEMNNKIDDDIKEISVNIGNLKTEIDKKEENIKEYNENKNKYFNKMENIKNNGDLNNKNGYSLILIKIFGEIGETASAYFFIILSIVFEALILILCQVLFIFRKYNPILDFKYMCKKKNISLKKEIVYNNECINEGIFETKDNSFSLDEYLSTKTLEHNLKLKDICKEINDKYNINITSKELNKKLKEKGIEKTGIKNGYPVFSIGT